MHVAIRRLTPVIAVVVLPIALLQAVDKKFHNAPDSARAQKNPFEGQASAVEAGKRLYARNCLSCHGKTGQGKGNVPSLLNEKVEAATAGEVFWFITRGSKANGMPAWGFLPATQRWQIVSYVKSLGSSSNAAPAAANPSAMALPKPREEPVTKAVRPARLKSAVDIQAPAIRQACAER